MTTSGAGRPGAIEYSIVHAADRELIRQAVRLHRLSLDQGFITSLGEPFLQALYEELLRRKMAFLVVARQGDRLQGFILASIDTTRMLSVVVRSPHRFARSVLAAIVRRPATIARLLETLSYGQKTGPKAVGVQAELIVIAVQPGLRSMGVGRRLLAALDSELLARGVRAYKVTVHRELTDADRFYPQNGFRLAATFQLYGVAWNLHVRELGPASGTGGAADPGDAGGPPR